MSNEFAGYVLAHGRRRRLRAGEYLFHRGDVVRSLFAVDDGLIELTRTQARGTSIVLQRAETGAILAEASLYSHRYHCDAVTAVAATVHAIQKKAFLRILREDPVAAERWAQHLAHETHAARGRAEILALRTVSERLDGWLAWRDGEFPPKGEWKNLARQIGVSAEALYRELSKRKSR